MRLYLLAMQHISRGVFRKVRFLREENGNILNFGARGRPVSFGYDTSLLLIRGPDY